MPRRVPQPGAHQPCGRSHQAPPAGTALPSPQVAHSPYSGPVDCVRQVVRQEGAGALWKGLEPGLHRQVMYGGLRIGLYEPVRGLPAG